MMFEGSHYYLIRTNPQYRMLCQMEDMRLEMEPSFNQDRPQLPDGNYTVTHIHRHIHVTEKKQPKREGYIIS